MHVQCRPVGGQKAETTCRLGVDMSTHGVHLVCALVHQLVFICYAYTVHMKCIKQMICVMMIMLMRTELMVMVTAAMVSSCRGNPIIRTCVEQVWTRWRPGRGEPRLGPPFAWSPIGLPVVYTWSTNWTPTAVADHHHRHHHHYLL